MAKIRIFLDRDNPITHDLTEEKVTVGRLADNVLHLDEASVSSHHAEILFQDDEYHLHDLGSTNGTFVNGEQITEAVLNNSDEIRFGKVDAIFTGEEKEASEPLPQSSQLEVLPGVASLRPENFTSSSPFVKSVKKRNPVGVGVTILAIVSFVAFVATIVNTFLLKLPG